jgi:hypothetical protein
MENIPYRPAANRKSPYITPPTYPDSTSKTRSNLGSDEEAAFWKTITSSKLTINFSLGKKEEEDGQRVGILTSGSMQDITSIPNRKTLFQVKCVVLAKSQTYNPYKRHIQLLASRRN